MRSGSPPIKFDADVVRVGGQPLEEPLLKENPNRYVLFPIEDAEVSK